MHTAGRKSSNTILFVLVLLLARLALPSIAVGASCKADGDSCRSNQACCGGLCINGAPPGSKPFGMCCTPTTCAAAGAGCGSLSDGCGNTLNCGSCTAPATCGGGGTPNVCGTTTTSTSTTTTSTSTSTTTSTMAATCADSDQACQTSCTVDADCPDTRYCFNHFCEPKVQDHRACLKHDECFSDCCCGVHGATSCGLLEGVCRQIADCGDFGDQCGAGAPCGSDAECGAGLFCTAGQCYFKQQNGAECQFLDNCESSCCCVASGASVGVCTSTGSCGGDSACLQ